MTGRFHYDYKTGRMKDTQSDFQATKDMRLIERQINDACYNYEKRIEELEKKYNHLLEINEELVKLNNKNQEENERLRKAVDNCQFRTLDLLDYIKEKKTVTHQEIKDWWNSKVIE